MKFFRIKYRWQSVCHHHQKWCKDGSREGVGQYVLNKYKHLLDMSSIQLAGRGPQTPDKRGGQAVAYQGRKKSKTRNMLILTDSGGIPLACSDPIEGNHNDAFDPVSPSRKNDWLYSILRDCSRRVVLKCRCRVRRERLHANDYEDADK